MLTGMSSTSGTMLAIRTLVLAKYSLHLSRASFGQAQRTFSHVSVFYQGGNDRDSNKYPPKVPQARSGFKQQENVTKAGSSKEKLEIGGAIQNQQLQGHAEPTMQLPGSFRGELQEQLQQQARYFQELLQQQASKFEERLQKQASSFQKQLQGELQQQASSFQKQLQGELQQQASSFQKQLQGELQQQASSFQKQLQKKLQQQASRFQKKITILQQQVKKQNQKIITLQKKIKTLKTYIHTLKQRLEAVYVSSALPLHKAVLLKQIVKELGIYKPKDLGLENRKPVRVPLLVQSNSERWGDVGLSSASDISFISQEVHKLSFRNRTTWSLMN